MLCLLHYFFAHYYSALNRAWHTLALLPTYPTSFERAEMVDVLCQATTMQSL